ncbi:MAG: RNA-dependent RNA polymerase [Xinjiang mymona-like virus 2]|uniref:RNA-directed RNA polymerase n=1 Tax=Xinjiang mymona-like virus 2 TaxID=2824525 RepID=A0ABX8V7T3_9MONO|nr:MAG: RNA-dependent RNA polymerase [Xinjiang mymona-like virus 2]QYF49867.1 MAG: RNA-dependent RNA polymerase [Xinjiang mymona-like virus 2]
MDCCPADIGDFSLNLDNEPSNAKKTLVPEKHLDSPISTSLLERLQQLHKDTLAFQKNVKPTTYDPRRTHAAGKFLYQNPDAGFSNIRKQLLQYCDALDYCIYEPEILQAQDYPRLFSLELSSSYRLHSDFKTAREIFDIELDAYCDNLRPLLNEKKIKAFKEKCTPPAQLKTNVVISAKRAQLWSDIVETYRRLYNTEFRRKRLTCGPVRFVCCDGFILLKTDFLDRWRLLTYEQLQMIQDCCLARHNVQSSLSFDFHNGSLQLQAHVDNVIAWQERVIETYKNDGYELVKAPEAIFKAHLNTLTRGDLLGYSSYHRTLDKMKEKEIKLGHTTRMIDEFDRLVQEVTSLDDAVELFGLSKLSGHPVVNAARSMASLRKEAEPKGTIQPFAVRMMERMFKHITLSGYIRVHTTWPKFKCPPAPNTTLRRHFISNVTSLPMGSYPISDLDAIVFDKFLEYDYSEDYLKFLDDKAICPGAKEMATFWFGGNRSESRRLLQKILQIKHFDTVAMVERLRKGNFTDDEYVVELTQKERELKCSARCFCKLPFEVRTFFTSTEYNLKEQFMSKYIPQQTMTMSSTETKTRMYHLVKNAKLKDRTLLEVDFSRWNLRWRAETVHPISSILEDMFGLPGVYSQAHPFFTKATVVMTDKHTLPLGADPSLPVTAWPESDLLYRGKHLGGFEGIQQALWTLCTISMMYWVLYDQNVAFLMAGQGDNQIFALSFSTSVIPTASQLRRLLAVMEVRCALLNHEVKPDECIDSTTVLTYSKEIYVEGVHKLYNLKFSSRTFKREEIDIPSLSTEVASISACAMACADSVYNTPTAIFWKTFQTLRLLSFRYNSPNYKTEHASLGRILSHRELTQFCLLLPGSLGGLPIMQWSRFFLKGEVDDLTWDLAAVRSLAKKLPVFQRDFNNIAEGKFTGKNVRLEQLILDPHSIPLERPKDLKRLVKEAVADQLPDITRNVWIKNIFNDSGEIAGETLLTALTNTEPFYPQIMSDVYALSPSGVRDALLSRFTMTRTINNITGNPDFATDISTANARLLRFIDYRFKLATQRGGSGKPIPRSYDAAGILRKLWGGRVQQSCIGVYNPFDFQLDFTTDESPMIFTSIRTASDRIADTIGMYPPNFGTRTKQKTSDHGFKILTSSSTVSDLKKLVLTLSELGNTPSLGKLLNSITHARSPWATQQLASVLPTQYGGTAAHRHAAINASAFSLLGSRTVPTHLNFCSDKAGVLSGGEFDFPIAFQEFYLVLTNIVQVLSNAGLIDDNASFGFRMTDDYETIPDQPVVCTELPKRLNWKVDPANKLIYVTQLMASEIPQIPQHNQIRHVSAADLQPDVLMYNCFLAKYSNQSRLLAGTAQVSQPVEIMDMKEFNHAPLTAVIRALCWFIQSLAIYTAVNTFSRDSHLVLQEFVLMMSRKCSPLLTRLLIHNDSSDSEFACENFITMKPGVSGARPAADQLAGYLYEATMLSIRAREFVHREVPLLLFSDYASRIRATAAIHAYTIVALQSHDPTKLLIKSNQLRLLITARRSLFVNASPLIIALNYAATIQSMLTVSSLTPLLNPSRMTLLYTPDTPAEAIRFLRSFKRELRLKRAVQTYPNLRFGRSRGLVDVKFEPLEGSLTPTHTCIPPTEAERIADHFCGLLKRPAGLHASALSVWITILANEKARFQDATVTCIGVGHGATAVASCNFGALKVYGVDLRGSFPAAIQREGTYKPPEVLEHGMGGMFSWSRVNSTHGGDARKMEEWGDSLEPSDVLILDIETDHTVLSEILNKLPSRKLTIVRAICCTEWARFFADKLQADVVYNTTTFRSQHLNSYVFVARGEKATPAQGNYSRCQLSNARDWTCAVQKDIRRVTRKFNMILQPYGETIKTANLATLTAAKNNLYTRCTNANDPQLSTELQLVVNGLDWCLTSFRKFDTITIDSLILQTRTWRALLAFWIANSGFDIQSTTASIEGSLTL